MDKLPESLKVAPFWALIYVGRMAALCNVRGRVRVMTAPDWWFSARGAQIDGAFFNPNEGGPGYILIREGATDSQHWRDVLAHEFAHFLHREIDLVIQNADFDGEPNIHKAVFMAGYVAAVESFVPLLGGLVQRALPVSGGLVRLESVSTDD